jgi:hypothetical protein
VPPIHLGSSRCKPGSCCEDFLYMQLKAGPAGGRLRRPSSAGNVTAITGDRPTLPARRSQSGHAPSELNAPTFDGTLMEP